MLTRIKKTVGEDDFSYFVRYFGLFTLIFSAMTLIIIQVMRSSLYTTVDENLKTLSQDPYSIIAIANRDQKQSNSKEGDEHEMMPDHNKSEPKGDVTSNTTVVLLNKKYQNLTTGNGFLNFKTVTFGRKLLNKVSQLQITNSYGKKESYRAYMTDLGLSDGDESDVKYAVIMTNISQLEQTSEKNENQIALVMICFWGISLFASLFLARLSVKPLLESMQKQKAFVENASHELRTPLAVLQNRLETLFRKPEATIMESSESIASSLDEVRNMKLLTTNLLNIARRDDGLKPEMEDIEPSFFDQTFSNFEIIAEENDKIFRGDNQVDKVICSDKTLLKQLMTILYDNALKYTDEDGEIQFEVQLKDKNLLLRVLDNGPGIRDEDKKRIFDRFYRVDKARTRQKGGFGLGLSLAKQIVESFKGTIQVKDNKPKGTIFEVKLSVKTESRKKNRS
ncbi:Signal transduction histidine-protein kinase ArlS [Streptococcus parasanguinis]|uniref:sensor histidine kinase n=1 Tax=Streptococcus parasanguinis TaxID=1318 RepID=UPI00195FE443|nr:HAMP domain-containing sensor histidine kinase [Streptococcus parasanguinis]VTY24818.1 Signal transduction histidine-protein kinase ArlS [Streptococcus parasanguinis]